MQPRAGFAVMSIDAVFPLSLAASVLCRVLYVYLRMCLIAKFAIDKAVLWPSSPSAGRTCVQRGATSVGFVNLTLFSSDLGEVFAEGGIVLVMDDFDRENECALHAGCASPRGSLPGRRGLPISSKVSIEMMK